MNGRMVVYAALLVFAAGCVQSIHPFYTDAQISFDPSLAGRWMDEKQENTLVVEANAEGHSYQATLIDKDKKSGHFVVHLAKAGDQLLADITPAEPSTDRMGENDMYVGMLLPLHTFYLVSRAGDEMRIRTMDDDWLKKQIEAHPDIIANEKVESDRYILTASTEQLQAFVLKNIATPGAFGETSVLHRVTPTTTRKSAPDL